MTVNEEFLHSDIKSHPSIVYYGELSSLLINTDEFDALIDCREIIDVKVILNFFNFKNEIKNSDGILVDAMKRGFKILIKNINDKSKLFNVLKPVIEKRSINGIIANDDFQICFTSDKIFTNRNLIFKGPFNFTLEELIKYEEIKLQETTLNRNLLTLFEWILGMKPNDNISKDFFIKFKSLIQLNSENRTEFYLLFSLLFISKYNKNDREMLKEKLRTFLCLKDEQEFIIESDFIPTKNVLEKTTLIMTAITYNVPILLIGETGTGKTSLIQEIHKQLVKTSATKCRLEVVNMSSDTDIQDLLGCYESDVNDRMENTANKRFIFKKGPLTNAIENGNWLLFDEINLASKETLNALCAVIEKKELLLLEEENRRPIKFHPEFRIFACMNPGNDHGKKDFKNEVFSEIHFDDFSKDLNELLRISKGIIFTEENILNPLITINMNYLNVSINDKISHLEIFSKSLAEFFFDLKMSIENQSLIGNHLPPIISGRTFVRFLSLINKYDLRILINLFFYTQISQECHEKLKSIETKYFTFSTPITFKLDSKIREIDYFILTKTRKTLALINCAINADLPILLQGPTSTGKTSVIKFFADLNNKKLHRINNHEHTDASDYLGNYFCDEKGSICFKEGILIRAMRTGEWIILDELNLAPSDVLEILNRLLDDNKEIVLNGENIKAHKDFRFFATQNLNYSGRKMLSKAFRNRFVEIYFDKFTSNDLREILKKKQLPRVYIDKMISIYEFLDHSRSINILITIRDLFKWCERKIETLEDLFIQGLLIILERQRSENDKEFIMKAFERVFNCNRSIYYKMVFGTDLIVFDKEEHKLDSFIMHDDFVFTQSTIRLYNCLQNAAEQNEPVLIVGETGIGKTRVIDILTMHRKNKLITLSMHQHIDSIDFIGSFTIPFAWIDGPLIKAMKRGHFLLIDEINLAQDSVLERLNSVFEKERKLFVVENDSLITAHNNFNIFACMNPGNDYGKKELTPALRNRFTEIHFSISDYERFLIFKQNIYRRIGDVVFCDRFVQLFTDKFMIDEKRFRDNLSIRKLNDIVDLVISYRENKNKAVEICLSERNVEWIFCEIFDNSEAKNFGWDILQNKNLIRNIYSLNKGLIPNYSRLQMGIFPFMLNVCNLHVEIPIISKTTQKNIKRILKAMISNKPILLQGQPGVGKTSFVKQIAQILNKKAVRINLSDDTEMSDLCGGYIPIRDNNKTEIRFIASNMVNAFINGDWVILDEINLASQSVIEGLNSVLDYRRELFLDKPVRLSPETRIFATMNDSQIIDGRKKLPKSFLDRFFIIKMDDYNQEDIDFIVSHKPLNLEIIQDSPTIYAFSRNYKPIMRNNVNLYCNESYFNEKLLHSKITKFIGTSQSLRKGLAFSKILIDNNEDVLYECIDNRFLITSDVFLIESSNYLNDEYVIVHSERNNLFQGIKCCLENIPFIINGKIGKTKMIEFIARFFNYDITTIYCHEEIDNDDLIGQYVIDGDIIFWKDSLLIENLRHFGPKKIIVFDKPESINKAVLDRLNSLFENERTLNIYEKGVDTEVKIDSNIRFVFLCDDLNGLSSAILDRFWTINLNNDFDIIDASKVINRVKCNDSSFKKHKYDNLTAELKEISILENIPKKYEISGFDVKSQDGCIIPWIVNSYDEEIIGKMINLDQFHIKLSDEEFIISELKEFHKLNNFYRTIKFNIEKAFEDDEKIKSLSKYTKTNEKVINFMKNGHLSFMKEHPRNISNFKYAILLKLRESRVSDYKSIKDMCNKVKKYIIDINEIRPDDYYFEFMRIISGQNENNLIFDPVSILKIEAIMNVNRKIDKIIAEIKHEFKLMYKYGQSNIETVFYRYKKLIDHNLRKCKEYDMLILTRNWKQQVVNWGTEDILNNLSVTTAYPDITDYGLLFNYDTSEFYIKKDSLFYLYFIVPNIKTNDLIKFAEIIKKYNIKTNSEFSKELFDSSHFYNEMLFCENEFYLIDDEDSQWLEKKFIYNPLFLDIILDSIFTGTNEYKIMFQSSIFIRITDELFDIIDSQEELRNEFYSRSIFMNIEPMFGQSKDKALLLYYQRSDKLLKYDFDFSWYLVLYIIDLKIERITEYLLNSEIYQFLERLFFIENFITNNQENEFINLLYNISLQYRSFCLEEKSDEIKTKIKKKIFADPYEIKKYTDFLKEETITHLGDVSIGEDEFFCNCSELNIWTSLDCIFMQGKSVCKFENIDWNVLDGLIFKKAEISDIFYNRDVFDKYSQNELILAKVFNEYIFVRNNVVPDISCKIENLLKIYIEEKPCLNFLKLIHVFINKNKKFKQEESADGVKEGVGEKNISEKIKDEEEIEKTDIYDDNEDAQNDDGVEMSNEGGFEDIEGSEDESVSDNKGCEEEVNDDSGECESFYGSESEDKNEKESDFSNENITEETLDDETESLSNQDSETGFNSSSENIQNDVYEYKMNNPECINEEQTCNSVNNYFSYVKGDGEEENALEQTEEINYDELVQGVGDNLHNGRCVIGSKIFDIEKIYEQAEAEFFDLVNSLRHILDGNKPNKFSGNYKTGKRINMRKIVPFILSDFTKDKIWLRRKRMEKRDYLIRIFVDASMSMNSEDIIFEIFRILRKLTGALKVLEIELELYDFGAKIRKYDGIGDFVTNFRFIHNETNLDWMKGFSDGINLVITDGIFQIQSEWNENFVVLIIDKRKIRELQKILIIDNEIETKKYLDFLRVRFCLIEDTNSLDGSFIEALKEMLKK